MYTILVSDSHELIKSQTERIMQRSKLIDKLHILVPPKRNDVDMSEFNVTMEYILPISRKYCIETLILSDELYKDRLEYILPFDTKLTSEAGDIEIQLTFTKVEMGEDGSDKSIVRKTGSTTITILPISAWSDFIPDDALTSLDQRLIKLDSQIKAISEMQDEIFDENLDGSGGVDSNDSVDYVEL